MGELTVELASIIIYNYSIIEPCMVTSYI